jgi:hypothetical protein
MLGQELGALAADQGAVGAKEEGSDQPLRWKRVPAERLIE